MAATTMSATVRQPFGEMSASRLQALNSTKNTQNAITAGLGLSHSDKSFKPELFMNKATKRTFTPSTFDDEDVDTENVDPQLVSCKKARVSSEITVTKTTPLLSCGVTPAIKISTASGGSSTAPAGRSPKSKQHRPLSRKKATNKRLSKSVFGRGKSTYGRGCIPLSLGSAICGTLKTDNKLAPNINLTPKATPTPKTNHDSLPPRGYSHKKSWIFDIHEDTPEEETWNTMLHSTGVLDVSSDDEAERVREDRGKENVPPANHVPAENDQETTGNRARRTIDTDVMVDDVPRSPLTNLDPESFYGQGLDGTSVAVIPPEPLDDDDEDVHHQKAEIAPPATQEKPTA